MKALNFRRAIFLVFVSIGIPLLFSACLVSTNNSLSADEAYLGGEPYKIVLSSNGCLQCHAAWAPLVTQEEWIAALGEEIVPGNGTGSDFYQRIIGGAGVGRMPPTGSLIPAEEAETIRLWINTMSSASQ